MSALELKEKDLNRLKAKVDNLLKNDHPASDKIEVGAIRSRNLSPKTTSYKPASKSLAFFPVFVCLCILFRLIVTPCRLSGAGSFK